VAVGSRPPLNECLTYQEKNEILRNREQKQQLITVKLISTLMKNVYQCKYGVTSATKQIEII
jgi:hypothetical protein